MLNKCRIQRGLIANESFRKSLENHNADNLKLHAERSSNSTGDYNRFHNIFWFKVESKFQIQNHMVF